MFLFSYPDECGRTQYLRIDHSDQNKAIRAIFLFFQPDIISFIQQEDKWFQIHGYQLEDDDSCGEPIFEYNPDFIENLSDQLAEELFHQYLSSAEYQFVDLNTIEKIK